MIKPFIAWLRSYHRGDGINLARLNEDMVITFSGVSGKNVLKYLIQEHMVNMPHDPSLAQLLLGKQLVVQDIISRMERHSVPALEVEEEEGAIV